MSKKIYILNEITYQNIEYRVSSLEISKIRESGILEGTDYEKMNDAELYNHFQENPSDFTDELMFLLDIDTLEETTKIYGTNSLDPNSTNMAGYFDETQIVNENFSKLDTFQLCQLLGNDMELRSKTRDELLAICKERISN